MASTWGVALVVVAGAAACGGASPPVAAPPPLLPASAAAWVPGEDATWAVSVLGLEVGTVRVAVGTPGRGPADRPEVAVSATLQAATAVTRLAEVELGGDTWIDTTTGLPRRMTGHVAFGRRRADADITFSLGHGWGQWTGDLPIAGALHVEVPEPGAMLHNVVSAIAALRAWDGQPGDRRALWLIGLTLPWRADVQWLGEEVVGGVAGNQAAVRLALVLRSPGARDPITATIWLSADRDRVPLRIDGDAGWLAARFDLLGYRGSVGA